MTGGWRGRWFWGRVWTCLQNTPPPCQAPTTATTAGTHGFSGPIYCSTPTQWRESTPPHTHREDVVTMGGAPAPLSLEVRKCGVEQLSSCRLTLCQLPLCLQAPHFTQPLQGGCTTNSRGPPQMGKVASVGQGRDLDSGPHRADSFLCTFLEAQRSQLFRFPSMHREPSPYEGVLHEELPRWQLIESSRQPCEGVLAGPLYR